MKEASFFFFATPLTTLNLIYLIQEVEVEGVKGARHIHIQRKKMARQPSTLTMVAAVVLMEGLETDRKSVV